MVELARSSRARDRICLRADSECAGSGTEGVLEIAFRQTYHDGFCAASDSSGFSARHLTRPVGTLSPLGRGGTPIRPFHWGNGRTMANSPCPGPPHPPFGHPLPVGSDFVGLIDY
jgi:hypothetical protein